MFNVNIETLFNVRYEQIIRLKNIYIRKAGLLSRCNCCYPPFYISFTVCIFCEVFKYIYFFKLLLVNKATLLSIQSFCCENGRHSLSQPINGRTCTKRIMHVHIYMLCMRMPLPTLHATTRSACTRTRTRAQKPSVYQARTHIHTPSARSRMHIHAHTTSEVLKLHKALRP